MKTYDNCVKVITAKRKTRADMLNLMDLYALYGRITEAQYEALVALMDEVGLE